MKYVYKAITNCLAAAGELHTCTFLACILCTINVKNGMSQVVGLSIDTVSIHEELAGVDNIMNEAITYRIYAECQNTDDVLIGCFGDNESPLFIQTEGMFFHSPFGGLLGSDQNPSLFAFFPAVEYDSFVTIGLTEGAGPGEGAINTIEAEENPWGFNFEAGQDLLIDDAIGGGWFIFNGQSNGIAGEDNQVLLAQVTSSDDIHVQLNTLCLAHGLMDSANFSSSQISTEEFVVFGCTETDSANYNEEATANDNNCLPQTCTLSLVATHFLETTCESPNGVDVEISTFGQFDYSSDEFFLNEAINFDPFYPGFGDENWGDFDYDGDADVRDFVSFLIHFGDASSYCSDYDSNGDGVIQNQDLLDLLLVYGISLNIESTTLQFQSLMSGTYNVSVIDDAGCQSSIQIEFEDLNLAGDLTGDLFVNVSDLLVFLSDFGCLSEPCLGDANTDGVTGVNDLLVILAAYGEECY